MLKEIKKNIKIDAVIPILNEEESLHQCLTSIVTLNVPEKVSMRINIIDGIPLFIEWYNKYHN